MHEVAEERVRAEAAAAERDRLLGGVHDSLAPTVAAVFPSHHPLAGSNPPAARTTALARKYDMGRLALKPTPTILPSTTSSRSRPVFKSTGTPRRFNSLRKPAMRAAPMVARRSRRVFIRQRISSQYFSRIFAATHCQPKRRCARAKDCPRSSE